MRFVFDLISQLTHLFKPHHSNGHRPKVLHPRSIGLIALILGLTAGVFSWSPKLLPHQLPAVLGFSSSITTDQVVEQTNRARLSQGLGVLTVNNNLTLAAQHKAENMLADHYWAHVSPSGKQPWAFISEAGYKYRVAGENLARDFTDTPDMIQAWLNSPSHRANLLGDKYSEIGVAVVVGKLDDYETTLVVQMFGTPANQPIAAVQGVAASDSSIDELKLQPTEPKLFAVAETASKSTAPVKKTQPLILPSQAILASAVFPAGQLSAQPQLSPSLILRAVSLAIVLLLVTTLLCDWFWTTKDKTISRLVGHNLAHIIFLLTIAILITIQRSGWVF